jgi:hypothetical protein
VWALSAVGPRWAGNALADSGVCMSWLLTWLCCLNASSYMLLGIVCRTTVLWVHQHVLAVGRSTTQQVVISGSYGPCFSVRVLGTKVQLLPSVDVVCQYHTGAARRTHCARSRLYACPCQ